jgi:hypothetical protein
MPQRMKDFGRLNSWRIYQTITTAGQEVEGTILVPDTETNLLEILAQNYKVATFESRNEDDTDTATFKIYGTRKYMESVPATGDAFWLVTGAHWTLLDTQSAVAINTNTTAVIHENQAYTYYVVTGEAASTKDTLLIARAVLSQN